MSYNITGDTGIAVGGELGPKGIYYIVASRYVVLKVAQE